MTTAAIRVLIVDDQGVVRSALAALLAGEPGLQVVGEAADGAAAIAATGRLRPDVVLMDLRMPGVDGIAATRSITEQFPGVGVLILTTFDDEENVLAAVRAGASGFLVKDGAAEDLIRGIRVTAAGEAVMAPGSLRQLMGRIRRRPEGDAEARARIAQLTPREREVLAEICTGAGNADIASRLFISEATVKTHVGAILAKLEVRDRAQAVVVAYEGGLAASSW